LTWSGYIALLWGTYEFFREIKKRANATTPISNITKKGLPDKITLLCEINEAAHPAVRTE
jgi:hypothetical protein